MKLRSMQDTTLMCMTTASLATFFFFFSCSVPMHHWLSKCGASCWIVLKKLIHGATRYSKMNCVSVCVCVHICLVFCALRVTMLLQTASLPSSVQMLLYRYFFSCLLLGGCELVEKENHPNWVSSVCCRRRSTNAVLWSLWLQCQTCACEPSLSFMPEQ